MISATGKRADARLLAPMALLILALSACAPEPAGPTLAETKSPVQLLRNETASRVPAAMVAEVTTTVDASSSCRTAEADPEGLQRAWKSSARLTLVPEADLDLVLSKLYISLREDGWAQGIYGSASIVEFTRDDSLANIHVSVKKASDSDPAELQLQVAGPCVMTAGEASDEVRSLEGRS